MRLQPLWLVAALLAGSLALAGCGTSKETTPTTADSTTVPNYTVPNAAIVDEATLYLNDEFPGATVGNCRADRAPDPNYLAETKDPDSRRYRAKPYRCDIHWNGMTYEAQAFWFRRNGWGIEASCSHNELRLETCPDR